MWVKLVHFISNGLPLLNLFFTAEEALQFPEANEVKKAVSSVRLVWLLLNESMIQYNYMYMYAYIYICIYLIYFLDISRYAVCNVMSCNVMSCNVMYECMDVCSVVERDVM